MHKNENDCLIASVDAWILSKDEAEVEKKHWMNHEHIKSPTNME